MGNVQFNDGTYEMTVELTGGSGRAEIKSPATVTVADGRAEAEILWSSPYYDYMIVGEETYYPVNTEGNSLFIIPVEVFDEEIPVIADTTAMSTPHEISYQLSFDSSTMKAVQPGISAMAVLTGVLPLILAMVAVLFVRSRRSKRESQS